MMQLCSVEIINSTPPLDTCSVQVGEIDCDVVLSFRSFTLFISYASKVLSSLFISVWRKEVLIWKD